MLKPNIKTSISSRSENHKVSIMSIDQKQKARNKSKYVSSSLRLSRQEKNCISENGSLLFRFVKDKLEILNHINLTIKGERIMQLCQKQDFETKISEIQETVQYLQSEIEGKLSQNDVEKANKIELNEVIYSTLVQVTELYENLKDKLNQLNSIQPQRNSKTLIHTSRIAFTISREIQKQARDEISTNHAKRVKPHTQRAHKIQDFSQMINVQSDSLLRNDNREKAQSQDKDSFKKVIEYIDDRDSCKQNQKLKEYFYSYIISLSATNKKWQGFVLELMDQLVFDDVFPQEEVENLIINDNEYCLKILITTLKNNFNQLIQVDPSLECQNQQTVIYFPNLVGFLKLTFYFIVQNVQQIIHKTKELCLKARQISQIVNKINTLTQQNNQNQENLRDTLSHYLPQDPPIIPNLSLGQFTFSTTALDNLKNSLRKTSSFQDNQFVLSASINVFQKIILKICFDRILTCKRYNFQALNYISQTIQNSTTLNNLLIDGFSNILSFSHQDKRIQEQGILAKSKFNLKMLKKVFVGWKKVKELKIKLLKLFINKKVKLLKKEQNLIFNRWRINISRLKITKKLLAHSHSCTYVLNKFTQKQIEAVQHKNHKNQSKDKEINMLSQITLKRSSSIKKNQNIKNLRNSSSNIRTFNNKKTSEDLKLLNYQYKQEIIQKLNRKTHKPSLKQRQLGQFSLKERGAILKV